MKKIFFIFIISSSISFGIFRSGDIVYIPAACYEVDGANGAFWNTDLYITNLSSQNLYVTIEFLPSGIEGRNEKNRIYKQIEEPIKPYQTLIINEAIKTHFSDRVNPNTSGALIIYGKDIQGKAKSFVALSRTYTFVDKEDPSKGTYGQFIPGIPWYYYIDPEYSSQKLGEHWILGLTQNENVHTNVGFINASSLKKITIGFELYDSNGNLVGTKQLLKDLGPLGHFQINYFLKEKYNIENGDGYSLKVTIEDWAPKDSQGIPALFAYASKVFHGTNDPIYIEATYPIDLNYNCVWP